MLHTGFGSGEKAQPAGLPSLGWGARPAGLRSDKPSAVAGGLRALVGCLAMAAAVLLLAGCSQAEPAASAEPTPPSVRVAAARRGPIVAALTYPGNVQARAQVPVVPEVAGRLQRLLVDVGSEVKAGQVIAEIDPAAYELQLAQAEAALAAARAKLAAMEAGSRAEQVALARANVEAARARLEGMQAGGRPELVAQAEANYRAAVARLEQARKGATPEQIAQAEANVRLAHNNEYYQQQQADALGRLLQEIPGDPVDRNSLKQAQLGIAWEQSKLAEAKLAEVKAGATPEQLTQLEMAAEAARQQWLLAQQPYSSHDLAQAQAALEAAEQQLALAEKPFTANELNAARAAVEQARSAVDLAKLQLRKATVTAPVDGLVAQRMSAEGNMAAPGTPLVLLVTHEVEVAVNVEEARLGLLTVGQAATITVAAYPGEEFPAQVTAIAPAVDPRSRTVAVKVRPASTSKLRDGMFAQVAIVTGAEKDALQVPEGAVVQRDGRSVVFVVADGTAAMREVSVGLSGGGMVEIVAGLSEGEEVVVDGADSLADGQAVRPRR